MNTMENFFNEMLETKNNNDLFVWPSTQILYKIIDGKIHPIGVEGEKQIISSTSKEWRKKHLLV